MKQFKLYPRLSGILATCNGNIMIVFVVVIV